MKNRKYDLMPSLDDDGAGKLAIKGGYYKTAVALSDCGDGYYPATSADQDYGFTVTDEAQKASVETADGTTSYYPSFEDALEAVTTSGCKVKLLDDDEIADKVSITQSNTIVDLGGYTLATGSNWIKVNGDNLEGIEIKNGNITANNDKQALIVTTAEVKLSNLDITNTNPGGKSVQSVSGVGVSINSGTYHSPLQTNGEGTFILTGGTYYVEDPSAYVAAGYVASSVTGEDNCWKVVVDEGSEQTTEVNKDPSDVDNTNGTATYEVTNTVKQGDDTTVDTQDIEVVKGDAVDRDGNIADGISFESVTMSKLGGAVEESVDKVNEDDTIPETSQDIKEIEIVVVQDAYTVSGSTVTCSLHPEAIIKDENDQVIEQYELSNEAIKGAKFKIKLSVPSTEAFALGSTIKVEHIGKDEAGEKDVVTYYYPVVRGSAASRYVIVQLPHFSDLIASSQFRVKIVNKNTTTNVEWSGGSFKGSGSIDVPYGTEVTVTVSANSGYKDPVLTAVDSDGDNVEPNNNVYTITKNTTITGSATRNSTGGSSGSGGGTTTQSYTLNASAGTGGTVSVSPTSTDNKYKSGTVVTNTATPSSGYDFASWSGTVSGDTVSGNTLTVTMSKNRTVTAIFTKKDTSADDFIAEVNALPTADKAKVSDRTAVDKALADYNALPDADKAKTDVKNAYNKLKAVDDAVKELEDKAAADEVSEQIDKLPKDVKVTDKDDVEAARKAYNDLTADQKKMVPADTLKKLTDAEDAIEKAEEAAEAVDKLIKALPENPTLDDKEQVEKAEEEYEKLTDDQKDLIPDEDKEKLEKAVKAIEDAEKDKEAKDQAIADAVKKMIDDLPDPDDVKPENKDAVDAVQKQYDKLTDDQKKLVPQAEKGKLEALQKALGGDQAKADAVKAMIDALPEIISPSDEEQIKEARDAYDALTDAQKALVPDYEKEKLAGAENQLIAEKFTAAVNAVPGNKAGEGKGLVDKATEIYKTMTDAQKAIVKQETYDLYDEELAAFKKGRKFCSGDGYYRVLSNGDVTYLYPKDKSATNATVPNQVKKGKFFFKVIKISTLAFDGCSNMKWILIHKNIRVIGEFAFNETTSLIKINVKGTGIVSGKVIDAFGKAGKKGGQALTVKVPKSKVSSYGSLFKGEGKLNQKATVEAA